MEGVEGRGGIERASQGCGRGIVNNGSWARDLLFTRM
jgi:hypothetical protein